MYNKPGSELAKSNRVKRWLSGALVGLLFSCIVIIILGVLLGRSFIPFLTQATAGPRTATLECYEAIEARDWARAYNYLGASLRSSNTPAGLEVLWGRRAAANGAIDRFEVTGTTITTNSKATVSGTIYYKTGVSEPKIVTLVNEKGAWKLSTLP
jgi:hypothetical protein